MALNLDAMSPEARAHFLAIGERYATTNTLAQADKILLGLVLYGSVLALYGFGAEDAEDVAEARDALRAQDTGNAQAASQRKTIAQTGDDEIRTARQWRVAAITILKNSQRVLRQRGNRAVLAQVQSVLTRTSLLADDTQLPVHMQLLHATLTDPAVVPVVAGRGGRDAATELETRLPGVQAALGDRNEHPPSTAVSELRDVLDGIIVTLARNARAAARAAARALGQPAIAAAFELVHLDPPRTRRASSEEPEAPASPEKPEVPAAPEAPVTGLPVPGGNVIPLK
jgi:hypothetical protein